MQAYQPYLTNPQMNSYQNFNPYGQVQNPYMDRMNQLQQYQQSLQQPVQVQQPQASFQGLVGRTVNDFGEIRANDVPSNGTPAIFVKNDLSEIEVRVCGNDGLIKPTTYKPILEEKSQEGTNIPQMDFNALNEDVRALREDILSRLDNIEKSIAKPSGGRGKKTEVSVNE